MNVGQLHEKINAICPIDGVSMSNPIVFWPKAEATEEQKLAAQAFLDAIDWEAEKVNDAKKTKNADIDSKTSLLIDKGFTFDDKTFSLSQNAQISMNAIYSAAISNQLQYPFPFTTMDDETYNLPDKTALAQFCLTALGIVATHKAVGRTLKETVNACTTIDGVNQIADER